VALPAREHRISLTGAAALTKAYRDAQVSDVKAGAIAKDQLLQLLNQSGCVGMRIYLGREPDGTPTVVLAGMDASDNDMTKGVILEQWWPCPPLCGAANSLNS
jgi:hypothetical protein